MNSTLCITFRFIQPIPLFHGCGDGGIPEWPPSPMRAFQSLLNAIGIHARGQPLAPKVREVLLTLESIHPQIIAPRAAVSTVGYRAYVPHNQTDLVAAVWHRGNLDASIASHRIEKDIRPMRIDNSNDELPSLHYIYPLDAVTIDPDELLQTIRPYVRTITHLGWGVDQVAADAMLIDRSSIQPSGERWLPSINTGRRLRVHRKGSFEALTKRHGQFLNRLQGEWTPVAPLKTIEVVRYRRDTDPLPRPHAVFKLVDANEDTFRYPHAKLIHIAAMVRHLAIQTMNYNPPPWIGNPAEWINRAVRGKQNESADTEHRQFSYIPLPSIGHTHADAMIRHLMVTAPLDMVRELEHLTEQLNGQKLHPEGKWESCETSEKSDPPLYIELYRFTPPTGKFIDQCYLGTSRVWHSVTPVILDGHNDKKPEKTIKLIQAALQRAGIETPCVFSWQSIPFLKNCLSAHKYDRDGRHTGYHRPHHLKDRTAVHVRLDFEHEVSGPLVLGAGRHCGFGLFTTVDARSGA